MLFKTPAEPTKIKKITYLFLYLILGAILSFLIHAFIEINYLRWAESKNTIVVFAGGCALPVWLQAVIFLAGLIGGYYPGRFWWRKLYVERVWEKHFADRSG